jgi:hypothetical protein
MLRFLFRNLFHGRMWRQWRPASAEMLHHKLLRRWVTLQRVLDSLSDLRSA